MIQILYKFHHLHKTFFTDQKIFCAFQFDWFATNSNVCFANEKGVLVSDQSSTSIERVDSLDGTPL